MAGPAPSDESPLRRTLRIAFGVTLTFVIVQLFSWPLAHPAPVFVALLLQEATPQSVRQTLSILGTAVTALLSGFLIALFLLPYPAIMIIVFSLLLFRFYVYLMMSGAHVIVVVSMVVAYTVMPVLVQAQPEIAVIAGVGIFFDFVVAILASWVAFLLIPAPQALPASRHARASYAEAASAAATLTMIVAPLLAAFLVFGWSSVLILILAAIYATGMSAGASGEMGWKSVVANLMYGGIGMLLTYELLVMVPSLPFMIVLVFAVSLTFGNRIFSGSPSAGYWASGFIGFLVLLGGALLSDDVVSGAKVVDRVVQILYVTAYLVFAYRVVDLLKSSGAEWRELIMLKSRSGT